MGSDGERLEDTDGLCQPLDGERLEDTDGLRQPLGLCEGLGQLLLVTPSNLLRHLAVHF